MAQGGVLFKVFVVGDVIRVVRRFSLPNVSNVEKEEVAGVFQFPRVSSAAASVDKTDLDPRVAELPPKPLLKGLVRELRSRLVCFRRVWYNCISIVISVFFLFMVCRDSGCSTLT